jgi:pilus assembly protein CpaE
MSTKPAHDPLDLDFEPTDEFTAASTDDAWGQVAGPPLSDPFADLPGFSPLAEAPDPFAAALSVSALSTEGEHVEEAALVVDDGFATFDTPLEEPALVPEGPPPATTFDFGDPTLGDVTVPRIAIHIFCAGPDTAEAAERAAADRRMAKATTTIRTGGLAEALQVYQLQATPPLVVVESRESSRQLLADLDRLAEVCDPGTKVVVIGATNDIVLYRELMRRGVSDYLVPPLQPLQLVRAVGELYADPSAPFLGRQVAFVGAKGGVGASTIAHNVAYSITERLLTNAVLVDLDLPFGTAGLDFNQDPLQGVADALSQPDRLDPVLMERMMARCTDRLSLFAAPANLDQDYEISAEIYDEVTQKIRGSSPFVVLDLPHAWTAWKRKILLNSDDLVIVATPDLASLRNAKNMVDLVRRARPNDPPPRLVLNQVGLPGRPEIPVKDFGEALGLEPALVLSFDAKLFGQAANNGQMVFEVNAKSPAAEGLHQLAQQISRREPPPQRKTSLLAQLLKRK